MNDRAIINEADHEIRLDRWFKRHQPNLPHAMLEKYLRKGLVRLDGKKAKSSDRLNVGQELIFPPLSSELAAKKPARGISEQDAAEIRKWVLYKDDNIIVLNKPFGLPVQGGTKINRSVDDLLVGLTFEKDERPKLVHRLDRDTSGVLVIARSANIAAKLAKAFAGKDIEKTYLALVHNAPLPPKGTIDYKLLKAIHAGGDYESVAVDEEGGKYAVTEYRAIETLARRFALMELKPLTGRTHQLRVHMQAIGCPIVGDQKYGGETIAAAGIGVENKLHLHAWKITIPGNVLGKPVRVSAPLPAHMKQSFEALGIGIPK